MRSAGNSKSWGKYTVLSSFKSSLTDNWLFKAKMKVDCWISNVKGQLWQESC